MHTEIPKGITIVKIAKNLTLTLSRPLKKKMILHFLTPAQYKKHLTDQVSLKQIKTIHMVCADLQNSDPEGKTKQELYLEFKRSYLAFEVRKDEAEYGAYYDAIEKIALTLNGEEKFNCLNIGYSHSHATVKQFALSFNDFCMVYVSRGANFRHPEEHRLMLEEPFYQGLIK